ncbi:MULTISPECIES: BMC domain-containing protein [Peptoniphilus]|uniref:BMC domain-containing protein n=1 Tax=Peptoniphilus TaxID=162289 RepID=UPI000951DF73|nr:MULTISPECIES: BMC domain-containing protein [Peptoniphilus]MDD7353225.1 BMC domain-containing protein [Peptoniphilaceae bacterium]
MNRALGLVEVIGLTNAIIVADTMLKAANIKMENIEITKGMGFVTVKVSGDVGAVKAAVDSGKSLAISFDKFVSSKVIPRPASGLDIVFDLDRENREEKSFKPIKEDKRETVNKKEIKTTLNAGESKTTAKLKTKPQSKDVEKPVAKKEIKEVKPEAKAEKKASVKEKSMEVDNNDKKIDEKNLEEESDNTKR